MDKERNLGIDHVEEVGPKGEVNIGADAHATGNALLITADGQLQKLPIPSADPNDPLNFSFWEKTGIIVSCCWFSIMSLALAGGLGAILVTFIEMYAPEHSTEQVLWLTTFPSLFIGIGNLIILPLSMVFGRRPIFLVSIFGLLLATIGAAVQKSFEAHLAMRIIQGLTTGATESLLPLMITEITFIHQRSQLFGFYWATQTALSSALNLASSYETASLSWRWYYWVSVFTIAFGLILAILFAFETRYKRPAVALSGEVVITDEFGVTRRLQGDEAAAYVAADSLENVSENNLTKKTYLQMLNPYSGIAKHPWSIIGKCWWHMMCSLMSPGIVYACLLSSTVLACALGVSLTYNDVLEVNYHWPASNVGLINIGGVIGAFLGMLYAGWPADQVSIWLARRNGGVHTPEHRLLMLPFVGAIGFASMLLYAFTCSGNATWWGPYIGWTLYEFCFVAILIITTAFAAECWPQDPGPALVMVVGGKNIVSFGLSYGLTRLLSEIGYTKSICTLAAIHGFMFLLGIPIYILGPKMRQMMGQ